MTAAVLAEIARLHAPAVRTVVDTRPGREAVVNALLAAALEVADHPGTDRLTRDLMRKAPAVDAARANTTR